MDPTKRSTRSRYAFVNPVSARRGELTNMSSLDPRNAIWARATSSLTGQSVRHVVDVEFPRGSRLAPLHFFFEIEGDVVPAAPDRLDFVALSLVFLARRHGIDLYLVAMLRHTGSRTDRGRCELATAMLVHGFDVDLVSEAAFDLVQTNAKEMCAAAAVPLTVMRTDWKSKVSCFWEDDFGAGLAACLSQFSSVADIGLFGSDEDYAHFIVPWGSNPITNHMLSSRAFRIVTEGGAFTRTSKVSHIAESDKIAARLRVFWQGPQTGKNCGVCEKCVRTKLNFIALGRPIPASLGAAPTWYRIVSINTCNAIQIAYLVDIIEFTRKHEISLNIVIALRLAVIRSKLRLAAQDNIQRSKRIIKRIFMSLESETHR